MQFINTDFKGLILINHKIFFDKRGYFKEKFKLCDLEKKLGYKITFCQQNSVMSNLNVLRGLHYQKDKFAQSKLISVISGKILDIAVDIRKDSTTYGRYFSQILSSENNQSIFIPKGFAHGYLTLSPEAIINYHVDNYYNPNMEAGIRYDDPFLNIDWRIKYDNLIISEKDKNLKFYKW